MTSADNDIVERLTKKAVGHPTHGTVVDKSMLTEAAAEIVRLRGEVAERADDLTTAYMAGRFDGKAIAPAEAKGDDRKLAEEGLWLWERQGDAGDKLYVEAIRRCLNTPQPAGGEAVAWNVLRIGNYGAAYDSPGTHRAFTYDHQPGNVLASRLGAATATAANASAGDSIDRGLSLLKALREIGLGVFQIGPEDTTPPAAQVQQETAYAERLARAMWQRHYREDAPQWEPCADLMGLLSQIDNMLTGLERPTGDALGAVPIPKETLRTWRTLIDVEPSAVQGEISDVLREAALRPSAGEGKGVGRG